MSAASDWPNTTALIETVKLTVPKLDKQPPQYPPEWLRERVKAYANDPEMVGLLKMLADRPALNKKLNRQPAAVRNQNIALHYQIACALEPKTKKVAIVQRIADLWVIEPASVKRLNTEHGPWAVQWLAGLIMHIDVRTEFATREDILAALDKDMVLRAPVF